MPILPIALQRRHAELGRIRLGQKNPDRGFPMKLDRFRFTSTSETYVRDLATLYGGEPRAWENQGIPGWEVLTEATNIPVIAVKGGLSQWLEFWSGGGCIHRCDGETNVLTGEPCDHDEHVKVGKKVVNPHEEAKPTTRLSVMLPELEAIGVWRMESKGWNAAAEIPAVAELAQFVGELVPARLVLQERRTVRDGETSRFVVPVLDLQIGAAKLREVVAAKMGGATELNGSEHAAPALEAAKAAADREPAAVEQLLIPTPEQIAAADAGTLRAMIGYLEQNGQGEHAAAAAARARLEALEQPDADGVVEADVVEDGAPAAADDGDAVWQQILTESGRQGITLPDLTEDFSAQMGGLIAADATAGELAAYLEKLRSGVNEQVAS